MLLNNFSCSFLYAVDGDFRIGRIIDRGENRILKHSFHRKNNLNGRGGPHGMARLGLVGRNRRYAVAEDFLQRIPFNFITDFC